MAKQVSRNPDGEMEDVDAAIEKWHALVDPVAEWLGATVVGFNPGVLFAFGPYYTLDLSVEVVKKISKLIQPRPLPTSFAEALARVPSLPQRQDALADQLRDLATVADRMGLYDAADFLRKRT